MVQLTQALNFVLENTEGLKAIYGLCEQTQLLEPASSRTDFHLKNKFFVAYQNYIVILGERSFDGNAVVEVLPIHCITCSSVLMLLWNTRKSAPGEENEAMGGSALDTMVVEADAQKTGEGSGLVMLPVLVLTLRILGRYLA
jgi:hypothetical protein